VDRATEATGSSHDSRSTARCPTDLVGPASGMQGDQLAAMPGADPAQDQAGSAQAGPRAVQGRQALLARP
jgi:hypothetical protein